MKMNLLAGNLTDVQMRQANVILMLFIGNFVEI